MAIKMDGHTITSLQLKASDGSEVTKQLTEEGTIPTPTEAISITANGTYDVTDKASAVVAVPAPEINLQNKTATANGEVTADEGYDGLGVVTVAVSGDTPTYQEKTATQNGVVLPDEGYDALSKVTINVPTPTPTLITKSITANGTYNASADSADGYSSVTVNVPAPVLPTLTNPASASDILSGKEALDGDGAKLTGACTFDADTSDADAVASDIAQGKTAYVNGAKVVGTASGGASEYWELTGGGNSSTTKQTVNVTYHGTEVDKFGTSYDGYWWNINVTFADSITKINRDTFYNKADSLNSTLSLSASDNFNSLTTLGAQCFRNAGLDVANFPAVEFLEGSAGGQFNGCSRLTSLILPKLTNFHPIDSPAHASSIAINLNNTVLTTVQIGSIGYGITNFPSDGMLSGATNSSLVITFYCEGTMVDTIKTAMRTGTYGNTTATIAFKASADTTYGGQSFSAGDTILIDAPSA